MLDSLMGNVADIEVINFNKEENLRRFILSENRKRDKIYKNIWCDFVTHKFFKFFFPMKTSVLGLN